MYPDSVLREMSDQELNVELAHARNRRDSYRAGSEQERPHLADIRKIQDEQARRRAARDTPIGRVDMGGGHIVDYGGR